MKIKLNYHFTNLPYESVYAARGSASESPSFKHHEDGGEYDFEYEITLTLWDIEGYINDCHPSMKTSLDELLKSKEFIDYLKDMYCDDAYAELEESL